MGLEADVAQMLLHWLSLGAVLISKFKVLELAEEISSLFGNEATDVIGYDLFLFFRGSTIAGINR